MTAQQDAHDWAALRSEAGLNGWQADAPELAEEDDFGRWLVTVRLAGGIDEWGYHTRHVYGPTREKTRRLALECARAGGAG